MKCPKCQFENPEGSMFCGACGSSLEIEVICPNCGSKPPAGFKFCNKYIYPHRSHCLGADIIGDNYSIICLFPQQDKASCLKLNEQQTRCTMQACSNTQHRFRNPLGILLSKIIGDSHDNSSNHSLWSITADECRSTCALEVSHWMAVAVSETARRCNVAVLGYHGRNGCRSRVVIWCSLGSSNGDAWCWNDELVYLAMHLGSPGI